MVYFDCLFLVCGDQWCSCKDGFSGGCGAKWMGLEYYPLVYLWDAMPFRLIAVGVVLLGCSE